MDLTLTEKFLILAMHPEKSRYLISGPSLQAGIPGAILIDLTIEGNISIEQGQLVCQSSNSRLSQAHQQILSIINQSTKSGKVKLWVNKFSRKSGHYRKMILEDLSKKGILKLEHKRFLFIPYLRANLIQKNERAQLISKIRDVLIYGKKPDQEMASILSLIQACQMLRILSKKSSERKLFKTKLNEIMKSDEIASGVNKVVREMQAAIAASVVITAAASSASH